MPDRSRVPQADDEFNAYINGTTKHLLLPDAAFATNWQRLGITAAEKTQWVAYKNDWNTKWGKVVGNKLNGISSSVDTSAKNKAKKDFNDWLVDPAMNKLDRIASSPNIEEKDRPVFNLKLRDNVPTSRPKIETAPFVDLKAKDGGGIQFTCKVESDSNNSNMHPESDVVEMMWVLQNINAPAPNNPESLPGRHTSTKAIFDKEFGVENAGKRLYCYLRWANLSNPEKSGPWNQITTIVISD
jgi:hypothetical protein